MRLAVVILVLGLAVASCAAEPVETTTTTLGGSPSPIAAVEELMEALAADEAAATRPLTFDDQLALLIGLEGPDGTEALFMLDEGVPDRMRANFWISFADGFPAFAEHELSELQVGGAEVFSVEGKRFAAVNVSLPGSTGSGEWMVRQDRQGRWRVDLFATFGPSFAGVLRQWLNNLETGSPTDRIRAAVADQRASLLAALQRQPLGPIGSATTEEVDSLLLEVGR